MSRETTGRERRQRRSTILAGLACVCFVLQQFLVPLHLALEEHVMLSGRGLHHHSHGSDHGHGAQAGHTHRAPTTGASARDAESSGEHPPHPIEEHLEELLPPALLPAAGSDALSHPLGTAPLAQVLRAFDAPSARTRWEQRAPRPPPPRTRRASRAPPRFV